MGMAVIYWSGVEYPVIIPGSYGYSGMGGREGNTINCVIMMLGYVIVMPHIYIRMQCMAMVFKS